MILGFVLGSASMSFMGCTALELSCVLLMVMIPFSLAEQSDLLGGSVGVDFMSLSLILLSVYLGVMMLMISNNESFLKGFSACILLLVLSLLLAFSVTNIFLFYFFFEAALVPTMVLILGWGGQPERLQAVSFMVVYTIAGSLPFLYGLVSVWGATCSANWSSLWSMSEKVEVWFGWLFVLGFLVKLPVFPFHVWLPKAHVEAPVSGSMALAGVLLKLGGYGLVRFKSLGVLTNSSISWVGVSVCVLLGGFFTSVMCFRQVDLKALVAYASVGHMSMVYLGVASDVSSGVVGALIIMLGHGLCSSGLFVVVDQMSRISGSRTVLMNKGYLGVLPLMSFLVFVLAVGNIPGPVSVSMYGEIFVYGVSVCFNLWVLLLVSLMGLTSGWYNLYFYVSTAHGKGMGGSSGIVVKESDMLVLLAHVVPMAIIVLWLPL